MSRIILSSFNFTCRKQGANEKWLKRPLCYRGMTYEVLRWQEIIILKIQNYFAVQHWLNVMKSQIPTTLGARANKQGQPRSIKSCTRTIVYNYLSLYFSYFSDCWKDLNISSIHSSRLQWFLLLPVTEEVLDFS